MPQYQPVSIDGIEFDALISHTENLEADIPDYPVEEGYSVQDTIILKPKTLEITVHLTNTPVTFREHASPGRVGQVAKQLMQLYLEHKLVTVTSSKGVFRNMGIESISLPYSVDGRSSLEIPISLKEVRKTGSKLVSIPDSYGRGGETGGNAGTATTAPISAPGSSKEEQKADSQRAVEKVMGGTTLRSFVTTITGGDS